MRVLEIGCGTGRLTRALANLFGEVHAVDVSGEMISRARKALAEKTNAHVYQNNGCDLAVVPPIEFDFAYSNIVFQHIPSREVIECYVREVHRLLRPGALFKFQVRGNPDGTRPDDTWHGASFSDRQACAMAEGIHFEPPFSPRRGNSVFLAVVFQEAISNRYPASRCLDPARPGARCHFDGLPTLRFARSVRRPRCRLCYDLATHPLNDSQWPDAL